MYAMILDGSFPNDIRVRKEAESLSAAGFRIMVICRWRKGEKRVEDIGNIRVYRIGKNHTHVRKGILDILHSIFFIDFVFKRNVKKIMKLESITTFHTHDLPLLKTILKIKGAIPLILDMHENYPEMLITLKLSSKGGLLRMKDLIFFNYKKWKRYERNYIKRPDHIIAVVDEMKDKLIREYAIDPSKITVISNYEKLNFSKRTLDNDFEFDPSVFYITYVGGIDPVRGLEVVVRSLPLFKKMNTKVEFIVVGSGNSKYLYSLRELSKELGCSSQLHMLGYKQFETINYYMVSSNLNVVPHIKNEHTDNTIPHKLFQIMLQRAPVLVSSCIPMKRIIEEHNAGYVFEASNSTNFVEVVLQIMSNKTDVNQRIDNAFRLVVDKLNWENESSKLIKLYGKYNGQ